MKKMHVIFLAIFLWSNFLFSQDKRVFELDTAWVNWEKAIQMNPDEVLFLDLSHSKFDVLPDQLYTFKNLQALSLSGLKLDSIPLRIGELSDLTYLDVNKNNLINFPIVACQLKNLETLIVSRNPFESLPDGIGNLTKLKYLDMWDTQVISLPKSMDAIKGLIYFDLRGINISPETQKSILSRFPSAKIELDPPCNCFH